METSLVTQAEYARRKNVSNAYISKLVKMGVIRLKKGKVDPEQADNAILDYADPSRTDLKRDSGVKASQVPEKDSIAYWRKAELQIKTAIKKLEHDEKMGELVNAADLHRELMTLFTTIKTRIRSIPSKVALEIADLKASKLKHKELIATIQDILKKEVDDALKELSEWKK